MKSKWCKIAGIRLFTSQTLLVIVYGVDNTSWFKLVYLWTRSLCYIGN